MKVVAIAFLATFGMLGCRNVHSGDLAGTWVLTDTSRQVLPADLQKAEAKLVLDANGTFSASELPGLLYSPPDRPELDSGSGEWSLVSHDDRRMIQIDFKVVTRGSRVKVPFETYIDISSGWSSTHIFYFLGDPDEGRRIDLKK